VSTRATASENIERVREAALRAVPYLILRQGTAQALNVAGALILARWLSPGELGVFALVVAAYGVLGALAGQGLLAGVVRAPADPNRTTLQTGFAMAQAVGALVAVAGWATAPFVARACGLDASAGQAFQFAGLAVFVATGAVVPVTLLERQMRFGRLAAVEVCQVAAFHVVNLGLVWAGWGAAAAGPGFLARALVGTAVASALCRWPIGYAWSLSDARRLVAFGGLFQATVLVNLLRDGLTPMLIGMAAGTHVLGFVTWAQSAASLPSMVVSVVTRVLMPAFARVQHDRQALGRLLSESITASHALAAPLATLGVVLMAPAIDVVFGAAWRPAVAVFVLCSAANLFAPTVAPVLALHNAIGQPRVPMAASVAWTMVLWGVGVPLAAAWGATGYAAGHVMTQGVNLWLFARTRREVPLSVVRAMLAPWTAAAIAAVIVGLWLQAGPVRGVGSLAAAALIGLVAYAALLVRVARVPIAPKWGNIRA